MMEIENEHAPTMRPTLNTLLLGGIIGFGLGMI
jgi:hypothetical protein